MSVCLYSYLHMCIRYVLVPLPLLGTKNNAPQVNRTLLDLGTQTGLVLKL